MKPSKGMTSLTTAWNAWVTCWKKHEPKWEVEDYLIPLRMRGYLELRMGNMSDKERKHIDASIRRGYKLANNTRWATCLEHLLRIVDWKVSYIGKTNADLWFPTTEMRDRCIKLMEAQLVMTGKFSARDLRERGDNGISIRVSTRKATKAHLTELRVVVDEFMAEWAAEREQFARSLKPDDATVRVPFDSFKER
jgi:hypothetical protein